MGGSRTGNEVIFANMRMAGGTTGRSAFLRQPSDCKSFTGAFAYEEDATAALLQKICRLRSPTGSGKTASVQAAAYERVHTGMNLQCAVVTPQKILVEGFRNIHIRRANGDICKDRMLTFGGMDDASLDSPVAGLTSWFVHEVPGMVATTTASFVQAWQGLTVKQRKQVAGHIWVAIDEAHHLANEDEFSTQLGTIAEELISLRAEFAAVSAFHARGDGASLFSPETEALLDEHTYERPFVEHWEASGFKSLDYRCIGYTSGNGLMKDLVASVLSDDARQIICVHADTRGVRSDPKWVDKLIRKLTLGGKTVLDLVTEANKDRNKRALLVDNDAYKSGKGTYDVIVSCNIMREGNDWVPAARVHDLAPSESTTRTVQTIGRMTRQFKGKAELIYNAYFFNLIKSDKTREQVSDLVNIALGGLLTAQDYFGRPKKLTKAQAAKRSTMENIRTALGNGAQADNALDRFVTILKLAEAEGKDVADKSVRAELIAESLGDSLTDDKKGALEMYYGRLPKASTTPTSFKGASADTALLNMVRASHDIVCPDLFGKDDTMGLKQYVEILRNITRLFAYVK